MRGPGGTKSASAAGTSGGGPRAVRGARRDEVGIDGRELGQCAGEAGRSRRRRRGAPRLGGRVRQGARAAALERPARSAWGRRAAAEALFFSSV